MPKSSTATHESMHIGLDDAKRELIVKTLNTLLSDEFVLYTKTRDYHWNVRGPRFHQLHEFFESQYEQLDELMDEVAEKVRQFGGNSLGRMADFLEHARIKEARSGVAAEDEMISDLVNNHETIIKATRADIDTAADEWKASDAADFLTSVLQEHLKMAWMLRAHLGK